jgi:hypothetical protein
MSYVRPDRRILRASDADRERAVDFLRRHAGEGRLDHDELADRVGKALSAKTLGELDDLTYDLPVEPVVAPPATIQPPVRRGSGVGSFVVVRVAMLYMVLVLALGLHHGARLVLPLLLLVAAASVRQYRRLRRRDGSAPRPPRDWPQLPF